MSKKLVILLALFAVVALADNVRPVPVNPPPPGEASLQSILDQVYGCTGCVNAATNQLTTSLWQMIGLPPQVADPIIQATNTNGRDALGIYTGGNLVDIFTAGAPTGLDATIRFNTGGTITVGAINPADCGTNVNCGTFSGISQSMFGFYLNNGATNYFSEDVRNGGVARVLAYDLMPVNRWALAFEDGTDFDYNDRVISIESITPAPEPGIFVLFGGMVALCAVGLRRRAA